MTEEDLADLKEGTVDYIGFSYYMSFAIDSHRENNPYFDYLETEDLIKINTSKRLNGVGKLTQKVFVIA